MGKVYTTSEDLTSVANAIRAKGGSNSSLVYPSGFITGIENIQMDTWDGFGANPEFVQTLYEETLTVAETNWDSVTSSSGTIRSTEKVINYLENNNIVLNWNYDYLIKGQGEITYAYNEIVSPRILKYYYYYNVTVTDYYSELSALQNQTTDAVSYGDAKSQGWAICYKNNQFDFTPVVGGITYNNSYTPAIYRNTGVSVLYKPAIQVNKNHTIFNSNSATALDKNNTTLHFTWKLYRYKKNSTVASIMPNDFLTQFLTEYPQYTPQ